MQELTKQLIIEHGIALEDYNNVLEQGLISNFKEFDEGFVSFLDCGDHYFLLSSATDNHYGFSMWKHLITIIDNRDKPVRVSFGTNEDRLFKASKRYNFKTISKNQILIT